MMKFATLALALYLASSPSQASTSSVNRDLASRKQSSLTNRTVTKSVLVRAVPKAHRRLLINIELTDEDDGPPGPDELDLQSPFARPRVHGKPKDFNEVSDYVAIRLAVARAKAMQKHKDIWANSA
jgi:hypothetical protein